MIFFLFKNPHDDFFMKKAESVDCFDKPDYDFFSRQRPEFGFHDKK